MLYTCTFDYCASQGNIMPPFVIVEKNRGEREKRENKNKSESTGLLIERSELFINVLALVLSLCIVDWKRLNWIHVF